jgi:hypothetical protein
MHADVKRRKGAEPAAKPASKLLQKPVPMPAYDLDEPMTYSDNEQANDQTSTTHSGQGTARTLLLHRAVLDIILLVAL